MSKQGHMSKKSPGISKQSGCHGHHNKPAELFRKDLISAMKLADTEILYDDEYLAISDPWRQEWEKGVQVPVNEEEIPPIHIVDIINKEKNKDFKMHLRKYLHDKNDETYQAGQHELTGMQELSEQIIRYDLDDLDVGWLELVNADREEMGLQLINEWNLERMIEELENQCYAKTNAVKKTEEGLGIEYDEDIACDVCRQLESEDTNEMVFCDGCDICVHQACYGIQTIPEGSWLCRICALGIKPMCLLCPKRGGAMKSTKSGTKWTHVSCALWIPEVSIGSPERMEPITKISNIPASRWALVCTLCKERVGACIQCSVKQCKTAFHVTCGFAHNLDMKTVLDDTDELDGIHLRAFCPKHTKNKNATDAESPKKNDEGIEEMEENENDVSEAEMAKQRVEKLKQLEEEFYTLVDIEEISAKFYIPVEAVHVVTEYWTLKRKVNFNKPLITPKMEEENQMQKQQKDSLSARMKMFVHLRQDLERARNLCYMIGKREKTKKQLFKLQESVFKAQITVLTDPNLELTSREADKIRHLFQYDSLYSSFSNKSIVSKVPRKNLFTLENLKTPKDLMEERTFDEVVKKKLSRRMSSSKKHSKHSKQTIKKEKEEVTDKCNGVSDESAKEELSGVDKYSKFLSDTTAESSENEFMSYEGSKTDSTQMSHLGKVKGSEEEIEEEPKSEPQDITEDTQDVEKNNKRIAGSDWKTKLTSILQSKSLKQKQDKLNQNEHLNSLLHIDVENSDDMFSSDTNTDFASPIEQPRNLFDKFKIKQQWSSPSEQASPSPDIVPKEPESNTKHKKGKKKHRQQSRKYKQSKLIMSLSKQSSISEVETKEHSPLHSDNRNNFDIEKDDDKSQLGQCPVTDSSDAETLHKSKIHDGNSSKLCLHKKKSNKDWSITSADEKSSPSRKHKKMSPSPCVDPENVYATIDGDIYVPSGKIQVTERMIVLESPKGLKTKQSNKLRLKKQTNSPVKGVVSYEVVNNDFDEREDIFKSTKDRVEVKIEMNEDVKNTHHVSKSEDLHKSNQKVVSEKKSGDVKYGKLLSDSDGNRSIDPKETTEELVRKDVFGITESQTVNKKEKKLKRSLRSKDINSELDSSSDENFIPSNKATKLSSPNRSHRSQRERRVSGQIHTNSNSVIKVQPFPNRPDLNLRVDPSKLIVKEPLKKTIGDKLSQIVKSRGRWGNRINVRDRNQRTLDSFVRRQKDNYSPTNDIVSFGSPLTRSDLKSSTISKSLRDGISPKKLPYCNGDVLVTSPSRNSLVSQRLSVPSDFLDSKSCDHVDDKQSVLGRDSSLHNSGTLFMNVKDLDRIHDDDVISVGSVASRLSSSEAGDRVDTPRRSTRKREPSDDSCSPSKSSRLRNREGLAKTSLFKSS